MGLIASAAANGANTFSTTGIDTTGADLLVVCYADNGTVPTLSDSKSNTWATAIAYAPIGARSVVRYAWGSGLVVGSGHTITLTGTAFAGSAQFWAWSGALIASDPLGNTASDLAFGSTTVQPGPITPPVNGCLVMVHVNYDSGGPMTFDLGFSGTELGSNGSGGVYMGSHSAYYVQPTAGALDPTGTSGSSNKYGVMVSFKPGTGFSGGGGSNDPTFGADYNWRRKALRPAAFRPGIAR